MIFRMRYILFINWFIFSKIKIIFIKSLIADLNGTKKSKISCFINLSNCCKKIKKYDQCLRFLKKALQYAWHFKEESQELIIYDELGLVYYLLGDLKKAKYYHER